MCGIIGYYKTKGPIDCQEWADLESGLEALRPRGPDQAGWLRLPYVALGVRRLRIIDLDGGDQPMSNEDSSVYIVYNGEIYDTGLLREQLISRGHKFRSRCDTEVLVHLYEELGADFVKELNGMFALAIWDERKQTLLLARDRFGIKPLHYAETNAGLAFASEISALLRLRWLDQRISVESIDEYLSFSYIPSPRSIFTSIRKLQAGHWLAQRKNISNLYKYWDLRFDPLERYSKDTDEELRMLLQQAIRRQMVADVPIGVFLSSGLDSCGILAFASGLEQALPSYTVDFDERSFSEGSGARIVARRFASPHRVLRMIPLDIPERLEGLLLRTGEPLGDWSIVMTRLTAEAASEDGCKAVLTGVGGDEMFGGYPTLVAYQLGRWYGRLPDVIRRQVAHIAQFLPVSEGRLDLVECFRLFSSGYRPDPGVAHLSYKEIFPHQERIRLFQDIGEKTFQPFAGFRFLEEQADVLKEMQPEAQLFYLDIKVFMANCPLFGMDLASMSCSVEARVPFLDHDLISFALRLPFHEKVRGFQTKYRLRQALRPVLPHQILRIPKRGQNLPLASWQRKDLREFVEDYLFSRSTFDDVFNRKFIEHLWSDHLNSRANRARQIACLVSYAVWRHSYPKATL